MIIHAQLRLGYWCLIVVAASLLAVGCRHVFATNQASDDHATMVRNTFPLKFTMHNFASRCYSTIGCKVLYGSVYDQHNEDDELSPPAPSDLLHFLKRMSAFRGGVENFPPPAVVTWRSLDGLPHEAKVDIGSIFKDERVLHHVPEQDIPTETVAVAPPGPDIILIVNDRTINVYMRAMVFLKKPLIPSNPLSNVVEEPILAYTHTY